MLKCRDITLLASDYIDGRLKWRKRLSVAMHLMLCPPCRGFMKNFRLVVKVMQGRPPPEVEAEILAHLDEAVQEALIRYQQKQKADTADDERI